LRRLVLLLAGPTAVVAATSASSTTANAPLPSKLRADLTALVSGEAELDPRVQRLVPGYRPGEIPYFAVLREPKTASHRAQLLGLGARILREYRSLDAFAVASSPATALRIAAFPWIKWLAPVELVFPASHEAEVDQSRATTADVSAPSQWDEGVTGGGVRIAVLDTGLDPTHPDLDDLDFRHWSGVLNDPKVVDARNFVGGGCSPLGQTDGHGHGTHVAGIATGTGEGAPLATDDGKYAGVAPDAELAVGKVMTDAGAGLNSDLVAAMEWAAMPADPSPTGCAIGADIVNLSLGSESRPSRLNTGSDVDLVSYALDHLAVQYGTAFFAALGNSGPFIGSALEAPGSAAQAISVSAAAKDWDVNHDDTLSGDTCAGWRHPPSSSISDNDCSAGVGDQPPSISSFSSRGPSGDVRLRPDLAAPGYNIVSAQAATGGAIGANDLNLGTRGDPLYATATGTSMATPAAAGSAALVLDAYRQEHGVDPAGASGLSGLTAPTYALLRAALMNTAGGDLYESRWILTTDAATELQCPPTPDPLIPIFCGFGQAFVDLIGDFFGSFTLYEVRNGAADPYVGPLAEGAGKIDIGRAIAALRDGVVVYSAASGSGADAGTGPRDLQGTWQVGAVQGGGSQLQPFVVHAAPGAGPFGVSFGYDPGHPSDGSSALPGSWLTLPGAVAVSPGGDAVVQTTISVPPGAQAGMYTGTLLADVSNGHVLRIPVFVSVVLHDPDPATGNVPGPQARISSDHDVFAKWDTSWPSAAGTSGTGAGADWLVYPVDLASNLSEARFSVYDADAGDDETYDLYLYDERFDLITSTHPFAAPGVTDSTANDARGPSTASSPQVLRLRTPAGGRHYVAVNRAKTGGSGTGDFGAFVLTLDEIRLPAPVAAPTELAYEGDFLFSQGQAGRLAARLSDADGGPIAGRLVTFAFDNPPVSPCPGGTCSAVTDYRGLAQVATDPIALSAGVHEVHASFGGDVHWQPSSDAAFVLVVAGTPGGGGSGSGGKVNAGGWFLPDGAPVKTKNDDRIQFAFHVESATGITPSGQLGYRDRAAGVDVSLVRYTTMAVNGNEVTLTGTAKYASGGTDSFELAARDVGEPGKGRDTVRFRLLRPDGYSRSGTLGGGNVQLHS
jgi:subtilisin family serine protease